MFTLRAVSATRFKTAASRALWSPLHTRKYPASCRSLWELRYAFDLAFRQSLNSRSLSDVNRTKILFTCIYYLAQLNFLFIFEFFCILVLGTDEEKFNWLFKPWMGKMVTPKSLSNRREAMRSSSSFTSSFSSVIKRRQDLQNNSKNRFVYFLSLHYLEYSMLRSDRLFDESKYSLDAFSINATVTSYEIFCWVDSLDSVLLHSMICPAYRIFALLPDARRVSAYIYSDTAKNN